MNNDKPAVALPDRIEELVSTFGTLRNVADVLEIDPGYLSRLRSGEKSEPSADLLVKLGLIRIVTYQRTYPKRPAVATPLITRTKSA